MTRHTILTLVLWVWVVVSFAQNSNHLHFMNISMGENKANFQEEMLRKGFTITSQRGDAIFYKGIFAEQQDATIVTRQSKTGEGIGGVGISLRGRKTWKDVVTLYQTMKNHFMGYKVLKSEERFEEPEKNNIDDSTRWKGLMADACHYKTTYEEKGGKIVVSISPLDDEKATVTINYFDSINWPD